MPNMQFKSLSRIAFDEIKIQRDNSLTSSCSHPKVAKKKAQEEAIARGESLPPPEKNGGGSIKKKDGSKK